MPRTRVSKPHPERVRRRAEARLERYRRFLNDHPHGRGHERTLKRALADSAAAGAKYRIQDYYDARNLTLLMEAYEAHDKDYFFQRFKPGYAREVEVMARTYGQLGEELRAELVRQVVSRSDFEQVLALAPHVGKANHPIESDRVRVFLEERRAQRPKLISALRGDGDARDSPAVVREMGRRLDAHFPELTAALEAYHVGPRTPAALEAVMAAMEALRACVPLIARAHRELCAWALRVKKELMETKESELDPYTSREEDFCARSEAYKVLSEASSRRSAEMKALLDVPIAAGRVFEKAHPGAEDDVPEAFLQALFRLDAAITAMTAGEAAANKPK